MTIDQAVRRVRDPKLVKNRTDAAHDFAEVLLTHWTVLGELDVRPLMTAMLERWSLSGLQWIKREGWKLAQRVEQRQVRLRS